MSKTALTPKYVDLTINQFDDIGSMLEFVRRAVDENGGMSVLAKKAGLSREALYRALSSNGNPTIKTLTLVLSVVGMSITVS